MEEEHKWFLDENQENVLTFNTLSIFILQGSYPC